MKKILIITPLQIEFDSICLTLISLGLKFRNSNIGPIKIIIFPEVNIYCAVGGLGKTQFAIQTQYLLGKIKNIDWILCVGSGGSLSRNVAIYDVVIGETTIEHDFHVRVDCRPLPKFIADPEIINRFRDSTSQNYQIHFGSIASGDEDICDPLRNIQLTHRTKAIAVGWEGAGGARAANFNKIPFAEIRGITDLADKISFGFRERVEIACNNIAQLLFDIVSKL